MTLKLELTQDLEKRLTGEAARLGMAVEQYVLQLLRNSSTGGSRSKGAELVAFWRKEGVVGSRPDIDDSQEHARALRDRAQRRR